MDNNENTREKGGGQKMIAGSILIVGVLIAGAIFLGGKNSTNQQVNGDGDKQDDVLSVGVRAPSADDHIWGNPDADIVIVEYSDTECPFCKRFHATMLQVVAENDGNVAWVYRHLPIPQLHQKAFNEALATECAWEQGGNETFWSYTNELYERTPSNDGLDSKELDLIATELGLNMDQFNECLSTQKYSEKVLASMEEADNAGIQGTPSSIIFKNNEVVDIIPGALPYEQVAEKISNLL